MPASPAATRKLLAATRLAAEERKRQRHREQALAQATAATWDALNGLSYGERVAVGRGGRQGRVARLVSGQSARRRVTVPKDHYHG